MTPAEVALFIRAVVVVGQPAPLRKAFIAGVDGQPASKRPDQAANHAFGREVAEIVTSARPELVQPEIAPELEPTDDSPPAPPAARAILITAPGFFPEITCDEYFAEPCPQPALTNSGIRLLVPAGAAPAKFAYHHPAIGAPAEETKDTASQYRGRLVHRLALGKGQDYVVSPHDRYQSDEAKAWKKAAEKAGLMPVKKDVLDEAEKMAAVVRERIAEACQGHPYQTEVVAAWQEETDAGPVWCRIMLDVWCEDLLLGIDVKNFADASDAGLEKAFANGGCATQHCFYKRGLETLTGEPGRVRFGFLIVEPDAPYLSREAEPTEAFRHGAELEVKKGLAIFSGCMSRGEWPGYKRADVFPPSWLLSRWHDGDFLEPPTTTTDEG